MFGTQWIMLLIDILFSSFFSKKKKKKKRKECEFVQADLIFYAIAGYRFRIV
jgi:hypothetical protein